MRTLRSAAVLLILHGAAAPAVWPASAERPRPQAAAPGARSDIDASLLNDKAQAGDAISISIFPGEEYSREVVVQPDGNISMPLVGTIHVKGMTVLELQQEVQNRFGKYLDRPTVTANVRRFSGRRVAILGEILKPGYYDYRDGMRLLELVSSAGGLTQDARPVKTTVLRPAGVNGNASFSVNLAAVLEGDLSRDPPLAPGDTVVVPKQPMTNGAYWVNKNILPWALLSSMIATIIIASKR